MTPEKGVYRIIYEIQEIDLIILMNAAYRGDTELVKLLIKYDAKLGVTAKLNLTALMLAVISEHKEIVRILVEAEANTNLKGNKGNFARNPLEYAKEQGNDEIINILGNFIQ